MNLRLHDHISPEFSVITMKLWSQFQNSELSKRLNRGIRDSRRCRIPTVSCLRASRPDGMSDQINTFFYASSSRHNAWCRLPANLYTNSSSMPIAILFAHTVDWQSLSRHPFHPPIATIVSSVRLILTNKMKSNFDKDCYLSQYLFLSFYSPYLMIVNHFYTKLKPKIELRTSSIFAMKSL